MSKDKAKEDSHESSYFGGIDALLMWERQEVEKRLSRMSWWRRFIYKVFRV